MKKHMGMAAVIFLALPVMGFAEDSMDSEKKTIGESSFSIGPRGTFQDPQDSDEGEWFAGAQGRLHLTPVLAAEGSIDYRNNTYDNTTTIKVYPVQASLLAYITPQYPVSPFFLGGVGWYYTRVEGPLGFEETDSRFGLHAGGGLEIKLNRSLSIDGTYRYIWLESVDSQDLNALDKEYDDEGSMVTIGLNLHF